MKSLRGFTMVEVIVIVAVIAILGGILTPLVLKEIAKSKISRAEGDMDAISTAFSQYYADTSYWPEKYNGAKTETVKFKGFASLYDNTKKLRGWDGPYMERAVLDGDTRKVAVKVDGEWEGVIDPWGAPFNIIYAKPGSAAGGTGGAIAVVSGGPNGSVDTSDKNALVGAPSEDDIVRVITARVR